MRWFWIDKFVEFVPRVRATATRSFTLGEDFLHDLWPDYPVVPNSVLIEGMAQTAGILVGEAGQFKEKVILAKIGRATFSRLVRPGDTVTFGATIDQWADQGASCTGRITAGEELIAQIELMFSHIDRNMAGTEFPAHNFVFTESMMSLLRTRRQAASVPI
jgi:3-hydroxyacyl-[acyl-carrier-protein] dehydratase